MITKNFKNMMALMLSASKTTGSYKGLLPGTLVNGNKVYISNYFNAFPYTITASAVANASAGIFIGSGTAAPTEDDYALGSRITSGFTTTVALSAAAEDGSPALTYNIVVNNTGSSALTITEIGYVQGLYYASAQNGAASSSGYFLLDRTLLEHPVVIEAGGNGIIQYTLKTEVA